MTINSGEYKSTVGLKDAHYALVTADGAAAYTAGAPAVLAPSIAASMAAAVNTKTQPADDQAFDVMTAEAETKLELEVTDLPLSVRAALLGRVYDSDNGVMYDNGGTAPDVALSFRCLKSNGKYKYYQFLKGKFAITGEEKATKGDTPDPKSVKLTYTAIKTVHQFLLKSTPTEIIDGVKAVVGDEDITAFDGSEWFDAVQVPPEASGS